MASDPGDARPLRNAWGIAAVGALLLVIAVLGSPGQFNPETCTNEMLGRGAGAWRPADRGHLLPFGFACELFFDDGSTELLVKEAWWPVVVATVGLVVMAAAVVVRIRERPTVRVGSEDEGAG